MSTARIHAPEFPEELTWLGVGHPVRLNELRGNLVVLHFWTLG